MTDTATDWRRALAAASIAVVGAAAPVFMLAATAALVRLDTQLSARGLGFAVSGFFLASALVATTSGTLAERVGAKVSMGSAAVITSGSALAMSQASRPWQIGAGMALAGAANGLSAPATNLALANVRRAGRTGIAFGVKQSALPAATLIAGASVPLIAVPLGWRAALLLCAVIPLTFFCVPYRDQHREQARMTGQRPPLGGLVLAAVAVGCASGAGTSMNAFYVDTAVGSGMSIEAAGTWYAVAGLTGICARLGLGLWVDRRLPQCHAELFGILAGLWLLGAAGAVLFGLGGPAPLLAAATALGYGAGWAWNGLFHMAIVEEHPHTAAYASGVVSVGIFLGGGLAPGIVGSVLSATGPTAGWGLIAALFTAAAATITIRSRRMA